MSLRDRLLTLVRSTGFAPARPAQLARLLGRPAVRPAQLAEAIAALTRTGELRRARDGRLLPATPAATAPRESALNPAAARPVFTPRRRGPAMPPPGSPLPLPRPGRLPVPAEDLPAPPVREETPAAPRLRPGELVARIQFRTGGSGFAVPEQPPGAAPVPAVQIPPGDSGVALPGDRVVVRIHPGRQGRRPGERVGRVVHVLERDRDVVVGELRRHRGGWMVAPDDPRFTREITVPDPARGGLEPIPRAGDKVAVRLGAWTDATQPPPGVVTARLGRTHEPDAELRAILLTYELEPRFPDDALREAAALPVKIPARDTRGRLDYRERPVFTIDPDDAKDFDDALSLEELPGGGWRVGVHIADVSHYVRPGSALDREAQRRGNSSYLVGTVVPMLPEPISNGLCSLVEGEDRLCQAVLLDFDAGGHLRGSTPARTVIRSRKRLTYRQALAFLQEDDLARIRELPLPPKHQTGSTGRALRELTEEELRDLQTYIRRLWGFARRLRHERMAHGSLDLDMPETKILLDPAGYAERLERVEHDESHQLIEEFMLAANEAVARLTRQHKLPSLYRVHDDPEPARLGELRATLADHGIPAGDLTERAELGRVLAILATHAQGHTLRTQLLRSLRKAAYRHSPDGHYGLHKKDYTHFTSPIRRYADLVVHRVLERHLTTDKSGAARATRYDLPGVERLAEHLSRTEINSAEAERDSVKVKLMEFFSRQLELSPPTRFTAVITDVRPQGLFIELTESLAFGFLPLEALRDDRYAPTPSGDALIGRRHRRRLGLNDRLEVIVAKVDRYRRQVDFAPAG